MTPRPEHSVVLNPGIHSSTFLYGANLKICACCVNSDGDHLISQSSSFRCRQHSMARHDARRSSAVRNAHRAPTNTSARAAEKNTERVNADKRHREVGTLG